MLPGQTVLKSSGGLRNNKIKDMKEVHFGEVVTWDNIAITD